MKNLKDIILEKLKVSAKTDVLSFTYSELCDSIIRFVNTHTSNGIAYKSKTEYLIHINKIQYFEDNPLIITNETPIGSVFRLQGCKVGTMILNINEPYITCFTKGRSLTLKDNGSVDQSFEISEETFNKVFSTDDLEKLYQILNEEV